MLVLNRLSGFGASTATPIVTSLSFVTSATSETASVTGPASIQAGDLLVLADRAVEKGAGENSVPTGFSEIVNTGGSSAQANHVRQICSYKIADGSEASASITGMNADFLDKKVLLVFRGDVAISSIASTDPVGQLTNSNPSAQTVTASGGAAPIVAIGAYGSSGVINPRTMSPTKDGEAGVSGGERGDLYIAYKIYNTTPQDVTVDMDDEGSDNILQSFYLQVA